MTYAFQSESTLYSCLNARELLARCKREIWSFRDCNLKRPQNHLVRERALNHLTKWLSVRLRTKWFWVQVQLQSLTSLDTEKYMLRKHSQKSFSLYKFSSKHLAGVRKNIGTAPFLDAQELHSWSTLNANVCIFLHISLRKFLFRRRSKLLSAE